MLLNKETKPNLDITSVEIICMKKLNKNVNIEVQCMQSHNPQP